MAAGTIAFDQIVPAGQPWSAVVRKGQRLRILDLEGNQGVDFLCYAAANPEETRKSPRAEAEQDREEVGHCSNIRTAIAMSSPAKRNDSVRTGSRC